ncbi:MAG: AfsR/SARP family transcriptional regulator, partial [Pseudonocardiaceae bacterium]|nr:AfsR/SARP family transcriptional regulator [Pseudonocardiaceae bacterium]
MEFRVLGPLEVRRDGRRLDAGSHRVRFVLALLLLNPDRLTSAETIIDGLWPREPPRSARAQLHNMIGR